ncbi:hypothetical protein [Nocardioides sp. B-3]|uniref:hypothetical protein n=1 Tax=Nocardioides sp. B-3 TaxID=2895565 RepID=UPI0021520F2E|nr:hypothetical protein [Nocardioides sp. B-3]UUZ58439.1 hypothetical protein LP418_19960 [Nocardioides sp. B-3]
MTVYSRLRQLVLDEPEARGGASDPAVVQRPDRVGPVGRDAGLLVGLAGQGERLPGERVGGVERLRVRGRSVLRVAALVALGNQCYGGAGGAGVDVAAVEVLRPKHDAALAPGGGRAVVAAAPHGALITRDGGLEAVTVCEVDDNPGVDLPGQVRGSRGGRFARDRLGGDQQSGGEQ